MKQTIQTYTERYKILSTEVSIRNVRHATLDFSYLCTRANSWSKLFEMSTSPDDWDITWELQALKHLHQYKLKWNIVYTWILQEHAGGNAANRILKRPFLQCKSWSTEDHVGWYFRQKEGIRSRVFVLKRTPIVTLRHPQRTTHYEYKHTDLSNTSMPFIRNASDLPSFRLERGWHGRQQVHRQGIHT